MLLWSQRNLSHSLTMRSVVNKYKRVNASEIITQILRLLLSTTGKPNIASAKKRIVKASGQYTGKTRKPYLLIYKEIKTNALASSLK